MFNKFLIKDTTGQKSVTMTAFVLGFLVVNLKLLLSGMVIHGQTFSAFGGSDYALALSALGGIYILRRNGNGTVNVKIPKVSQQNSDNPNDISA